MGEKNEEIKEKKEMIETFTLKNSMIDLNEQARKKQYDLDLDLEFFRLKNSIKEDSLRKICDDLKSSLMESKKGIEENEETNEIVKKKVSDITVIKGTSENLIIIDKKELEALKSKIKDLEDLKSKNNNLLKENSKLEKKI